VLYILNGQGTSQAYGNKNDKNGRKAARDLEKLWIGAREGKVTRTIQYPVTSWWAKELDKT